MATPITQDKITSLLNALATNTLSSLSGCSAVEHGGGEEAPPHSAGYRDGEDGEPERSPERWPEPCARHDPGGHRFDFGAIWHGDFFRNADEGSFGTDCKPNHFAMVLGKASARMQPSVRMAPITSQPDAFREGRLGAICLPAGMLDTRMRKPSYILPEIKLVVSRSRLIRDFTFRQRLPGELLEATMQMVFQ